MNPVQLRMLKGMSRLRRINGVAMHKAPDADVIGSYTLGLKYGRQILPGFDRAPVLFWGANGDPEGRSWQELWEKRGIICLDTGGGPFDHHTQDGKIIFPPNACSTTLMADFLDVQNLPELARTLKYILMDDTQGITDPWSFARLIADVAKKNSDSDTLRVGQCLIEARIAVDEDRVDCEQDTSKGAKIEVPVEGYHWPIKIMSLTSDNTEIHKVAMDKGSHMVIVQRRSGHVQIFTARKLRLGLRKVVAKLRKTEVEVQGIEVSGALDYEAFGDLYEIPEWHFPSGDQDGKPCEVGMILNGSSKVTDKPPTQIPLRRIAEITAQHLFKLESNQ